MLALSGERQLDDATEEKNYRRIERRYGSFTRSFSLPHEVDAEAVKARFKEGLLTIEAPRRKRSSRVRSRSTEASSVHSLSLAVATRGFFCA